MMKHNLPSVTGIQAERGIYVDLYAYIYIHTYIYKQV